MHRPNPKRDWRTGQRSASVAGSMMNHSSYSEHNTTVTNTEKVHVDPAESLFNHANTQSAIYLEHEKFVNCALMLKGGYVVTASLDCYIRVWKVEIGISGSRLINQILAGEFVKLGLKKLYTKCNFTIKDINNNDERSHSWQYPVTCMVALQDGIHIATGGRDRSVKVWKLDFERNVLDEANTKPIRIFRHHEYAVTCLCPISDGIRLISGSFDRTLVVWDLENPNNDATKLFVLSGHERSVRCVTELKNHKNMIASGGWVS